MSSLSDRLARDPEPWMPEPGDSVEGEVVEVALREGKFGVYPVVSLLTEDGNEVEFHAWHGVASGRLHELDPQEGDTLAVKYQGQRTSGGGNSYHSYRILIQHGPNRQPTAPAPAAEVEAPSSPPQLPSEVIALKRPAPAGYDDEESF